ncbi:family 20 glycosylhydrolase [Pedobacter insulae]|uniref:beta-N-acetylhexosaminidase n=1 Tax=Pedobacter insulae TaxID=414048 RepID=A0A1I2WJF3_9SPHI|nr:family 20 glycosylhydrolase [Pedobacter insulae]SFH00777.1 N-acetyl-beta-hexosaminidase [Pedobacter insulae]
MFLTKKKILTVSFLLWCMGVIAQAPLTLIPKPQSLVLSKDQFPIHQVKYIFYSVDSLKNEALLVQKILAAENITAKIVKGNKAIGNPFIKLEIGSPALGEQQKEAYRLKVEATKIVITAYTRTGIYYGAQTLKQLSGSRFVKAIDIQDAPAFAWRGYMVDVGRNYQSMAMLKQQIDVMAQYKLNVFHMHLTEDIAWRLAIKRYPELTNAQYMERNKGKYYSTAEIKELIRYCRERHIQFVPEIDMPGHSAAFKRAMKVDMQSDSGLAIVKNILKEFCETYDLPYIHIGADEVKITNKNFLPEILALLKSLNKKVVGWEPGGNFDESTIRQLWMDDAGLTSGKTKIQYIDSRHLYVNHMDPLESVVTIFNRQLADVDTGNETALGATLCVWPDRAVAHESDILRMNGVYPAMLAFAERSWLGKGYSGWVANMDLNGAQALTEFKDFERRLLVHQQQNFTGMPFPYQAQSTISWQLYGPYPNGGDLSKAFEPEKPIFKQEEASAKQTALGATIILRHWWAPKIKGVIQNPSPNTTWYAFRKIWAEKDTIKNFWIGFGNPSRSQATDTPPLNQWDTHQSAVWLNGELISPPVWLRAGQKGNLEIPYVDESYEYRPPVSLKLRKGWNIIRIKAPIGSFNGKNWNNPEKWMFTFVAVPDAVPKQSKYKLVWSDEFKGKGGFDSTKWQYSVRGKVAWNKYMTALPAYASLNKGNLLLRMDSAVIPNDPLPYHAGGVQSSGKFSITYGKIEVRAKFTQGKGSWPAIWMMPEPKTAHGNGWPAGGEIDIMEHVNNDSVIYQTIHNSVVTDASGGSKASNSTSYRQNNYNIYTIEWTPSSIKFFVNNVLTYTYLKAANGDLKQWPFDVPFYLILNQAGGAGWPGPINKAHLPFSMQVDYVRIYKLT